MKSLTLLVLLLFLLVSCFSALAEDRVSCQSLVARVVRAPSFPARVLFRAGAKTTETFEAKGHIFTGVFLEIPLLDPEASARLREFHREAEKVISALFRFQDLTRQLAFQKDLVHYHQRRVEMGLEDNRELIRAKEKLLEIEARRHEAEAVLRAYGISPKEALSCHW